MSCPRPAFAARLLAGCCVAAVGSASAQGAAPGNLPTDHYKHPGSERAAHERTDHHTLPGGFAPVVHLRTFYMDGETLSGAEQAAWALGGWAGVRSPWWGDMFQIGLVGYTSQKLYGPDDKDGTRLLATGQSAINVIGEAYASLKVFDQTLTGYRQIIHRPFINAQDNRMVPNAFEAYTLTGATQTIHYAGGYIDKIKTRDSNDFESMSAAAGGTGADKGTIFAGATWDYVKHGYVRADAQFTDDVFNTYYADGKFPIAIDSSTMLTLGAQYIHQKSTGAAQIGNFSTKAGGVQAAIDRGAFGAQVMYTQTSSGFDTQNPYGDHPTYLYLMQSSFNGAGEKAWGISGHVNFAGFGVPGLTAAAVYASGRDRVHGPTGAPVPDRSEFDIRADYAFAKGTVLEGLVATLRYAALRQDGSPQTAPQFRAYVNYAVRF